MRRKNQSNKLGHWGELLACEYLISKGYGIVERNWKLENYEIDIVANHNGRVVFVEVKTRRKSDGDDPATAVNRSKMRRIAVAADSYMRLNDLPHEVQFDIITVTGTPDDYTLTHIDDAFLSPLKNFR